MIIAVMNQLPSKLILIAINMKATFYHLPVYNLK